MFKYNLGGFHGIIKFFGIYAILDLALIRSDYSLLLRYNEKTNYSVGAKAVRFKCIGSINEPFSLYASIFFGVVRVRLA